MRYTLPGEPPIAWFRDRGQICAFAVSSNFVPATLKYRLPSFWYCPFEIMSRPVVASSVAPVSDMYRLNASVASRISVVPVSRIPAVDESTFEPDEPYVTLWSSPQ